jgi:hypothetical protein
MATVQNCDSYINIPSSQTHIPYYTQRSQVTVPIRRKHSRELSPSWEGDSHSNVQRIARPLWQPKYLGEPSTGLHLELHEYEYTPDLQTSFI